MDLSDFRTAQGVVKIIRDVASSEIEKKRPAARYAVVQSINLEDRSIMGVFVGETDAVRIPFLDTIPAFVGQEVRVSGTGSDRVVDGIRGTSDSENRIAELEAALAHWSQKAYAHGQLSSDYTQGTSAAKIPINSALGVLPYHMQIEADGSFLVEIPGDYRYSCTIQTEEFRSRLISLWIAHTPAGGSQSDLQTLYNLLLSGSFEYTDTTPFTAVGYKHLGAGDRIYANGHATTSTQFLKVGTRFSLELVNPDPIVYPEAP